MMVIELLGNEVTHLTTVYTYIFSTISIERCFPASILIADDNTLEHIKSKETIRSSAYDDKWKIACLREEIYLMELLDIRVFMYIKKIPYTSRSLERREERDIVVCLEIWRSIHETIV